MSTDSAALWYLSRGTGIVSLLLLTLVVALGALTRGTRTLPTLPKFGTYQLHRYASLTAVGLLVLHISTAIIDPFVSIRWVDAFVPFISTYHPLSLGLGALTLDLLIVVMVTSLLRHRINTKVWRAIHWSAYALWPLAVVHGLAMGPDIAAGTYLLVLIAAIAGAMGAITRRQRPVKGSRGAPAHARLPGTRP